MGNLASAVDELVAVDVRDLPDVVLVEEVVALGRVVNRVKAAYLARLEVLDRRGVVAAEHGSTAAWLRAELRLAPGAASRDVHLARDLADVLPAVAAGMADGEISAEHAQVLTMLRRDLPDDAVRSADPHLAEAARGCSPAELRGFGTTVRHSYAAEGVARAETSSYDDRRLHTATTLDGVGVGDWSCDPVSHETIMTAIHAASAPVSGDDRTPAQRRLDGLVTVCELAMSTGQLPDDGGVKPHVTVIVDLTTLAATPGAPPASLCYGAAISGAAARRIACDAEISRIITGPRGEILDAGRSTRTFTAGQRRAITARDRHCRWPGCDRPPPWCDAHHQTHWATGGTTSLHNAVLLCRRYHDRVHHHHAIHTNPDGTKTINPHPNTDHQHTPTQRAGP